MFCRRFSKVEAPDEVHVKCSFFPSGILSNITVRDLLSLPNVKSLDFSSCSLNDHWSHELFQILPHFTSLTELSIPDVPKMTDWRIVAEILTSSKTLETMGCFLLGERGEGWARALDAGLCADTPLSSVNLTICGPMSETALQALENLLLNKSLSSVSVIVKGEMSHSLAFTLSRALAGETAVKSLGLSIFGKLSFYCANLIERGIVKNNSLSNLVVSLCGELPDNWQAIVENLKVKLAEKSTVTFEIQPNTFSPVTPTQLTDVRPCLINCGLFEQRRVTLNVWGELTIDGVEAVYNVFRCSYVCHLTLNIHGKLTDDFLHCTARHVDKEKPLCPITINTWEQLTNEGKALFKELELDKNPAVTLNVCEVQLPSEESGDNEIVFVNNPASLIALLESAEDTGKENLTVTINVQSGESKWDFSDDSIGRSWNDSLDRVLPRNYSLNSLTLTINNFSKTELCFTLIRFLKSFISLNTLNLTLNEYNTKWTNIYAFKVRESLGGNTSLIALTLTLNIWTESSDYTNFGFSDNDIVPNMSINSFTLTINDFSGRGNWGLSSDVLWSKYKSLNTFNLTLNNWDEDSDYSLLAFLDAMMAKNSTRTLTLKINDWTFRNGVYPKYDFSGLVVKSPSLELIELTICRYGGLGSWLETLKWEKQ